jgi:outer membrane lipoprotein-sorting protein
VVPFSRAMNLLSVILPVLLGFAPKGPPQNLPAELAPLRESLRHTRTLSARFEQTKHLKSLQDVLVTTGQLNYRRGGQLRWHTDAPGESELLLDGSTASLKMPGMSSPQAMDLSSDPGMGRVFETLRAVLEADFDRLTALFDLQIVRARPLSVSLKPRTAAVARALEGIRLDFDAGFRLLHVSLREPDGDRTDIAFREHIIETSPN